MSVPLSWENLPQRDRTDDEFARDLVRSVVNGLREAGMKAPHAVVCASTPCGMSPRKMQSMYEDAPFRATRDDIRLIRIGRRRIATWVAGWHRRRAAYWEQIAREEEAAAEGRQLMFREAKQWRRTMMKSRDTDELQKALAA